MLKNTFHHIPGIGIHIEKDMWRKGILDWKGFQFSSAEIFSQERTTLIKRYIDQSYTHLQSDNPNYFTKLLPSKLHWRIFPEFRHLTAYLDIETTGMDTFSTITTIALYDGIHVRWYVDGENLDQFIDDISTYKVIVTYNGKGFDIPFIENQFGVTLDHSHIDLRYILAALGFSGGLKGCERQLGINRGSLSGVDGYFAVLLWDDYIRNNNPRALDTLLAYNIEDTINLEKLMVMAYNKNLKNTPFVNQQLEVPSLPHTPFSADMETIESIKRNLFGRDKSYAS
jgi:uncharacterized protein YprB with RNaseH-like and TPR domain